MVKINRPIGEIPYFELWVAIIVLIFICLTSCKCPQVVEQTVVHDSIVYHDSVVVVHDTDVFSTFAYVDSILELLNRKTDTVIIKTTKRGVTTSLRVANGKLICEATIDSLQAKIDSIKSHVTYVEKTRNVLIERNLTKWERLKMNLFWVFLAIIAIALLWKAKS